MRTLPEAVTVDRNFLETLPDALMAIDLSSRRVIYMNNMALDLFGYTIADVSIGVPTKALLPPDEHKRALEIMDRYTSRSIAMQKSYARQSGQHVYDFVMKKKDGTLFSAETQTAFILDAAGIPVGMHTTMRDTTRRRRNDALMAGQNEVLELLASGEKLENVLIKLIRVVQNLSPDLLGSVLLMDEDGKRLRKGFSAGLPPAYVDGMAGIQVGPSAGSCGTAAFVGEKVIVEDIAVDPRWKRFRGMAKSFGMRACWSQPVFASQGRILGTFAMHCRNRKSPEPADLDVLEGAARLAGIAIEHNATAVELRSSQKKFRLLVENSGLPISYFDKNGRFLFVNDNGANILGHSREQLIGSSLHDHFSGHQAALFIGRLQNVIATGRNEYHEDEVEGAGQKRWFWSILSPVRDHHGDISGVQIVSHDITDRKQIEIELRRHTSQLEARVEERTAKLQEALHEVQRLKNHLEAENIYLRHEARAELDPGEIVGASAAIKHALMQVRQVAPTDATVLLTGETGTGKELVAHALHNNSLRKGKPFIKVNCAALPANLIENELFGHEKGAFSGAVSRKLGRFEIAHEGSIFLDEVSDLPLELQPKLLRVLQSGDFERVGDSFPRRVDVRVIAASNQDLETAVREKRFREDLFFRLNVFPIIVPPLRDRKDDIPLLATHFLKVFARKFRRTLTTIPEKIIAALQEYDWPGNVRELENVIERAVITSNGDSLRIDEAFHIRKPDADYDRTNVALADIERDHIIRVLHVNNWIIEGPRGAARTLGMKPGTLRSRMKKLGITRPS